MRGHWIRAGEAQQANKCVTSLSSLLHSPGDASPGMSPARSQKGAREPGQSVSKGQPPEVRAGQQRKENGLRGANRKTSADAIC